MRAATTALALLALSLTVAGCGTSDPDEDAQRKGPEATAAAVEQGDELDPPESGEAEVGDDGVPAEELEELVAPAGGGGAAGPAEVVSLYARLLSNWTWRDVARKNRSALARLAAGELRQGVRANARELRADATLKRERLGSRGKQLAIDVQGSDPRRRRVWVVLRETALANGETTQSGPQTTVYRATAERLDDDRWYVTAFVPQG